MCDDFVFLCVFLFFGEAGGPKDQVFNSRTAAKVQTVEMTKQYVRILHNTTNSFIFA